MGRHRCAVALIVVLTLAMWITYAAIYFMATKLFNKSPQDAAVLTLTVALPNYAALGLPSLGSVLGETSSTSLSVAVSHRLRLCADDAVLPADPRT